MEVWDEALLSCLGRGNGNRQQDALYAATTPATTQIQHKPKDCLGSSTEIRFVINSTQTFQTWFLALPASISV